MPDIDLAGIPFDLDATLSCGQVFCFERDEEGWWRGAVSGRRIELRREDCVLQYHGADEAFVRHYLALDIDLAAVIATFDCDPLVREAISRVPGLRIVRQDPWECLLSFLCAQNANIPYIGRMLAGLRRECCVAGTGAGLPPPETVAAQELDVLAACPLGYRARYVKETASAVAADPGWADRIRSLGYEDAARELRRLSGVGPKVADCVLLFGFQQYQAFPVDVWIRRIMNRHYLKQSPAAAMTQKEYDMIAAFGRKHFGPYAGWAQEYLFAAFRNRPGT